MTRKERIRQLRESLLPELQQELRLAQAEERYLRLLEQAGVPDGAESPEESPGTSPGMSPGVSP